MAATIKNMTTLSIDLCPYDGLNDHHRASMKCSEGEKMQEDLKYGAAAAMTAYLIWMIIKNRNIWKK